MKNLRRRTLITVSILALVVIILGGIFFALVVRISRLHALTASLELEREQESERVLRVESLREVVKDAQKSSDRIDTYFIREKDIVRFIETLEAVARASEVSLSITSVKTELTPKAHLFVELDFRGSFSQDYQALLLLENLPYVLEIKSVYITPEQGNASAENTTTAPSLWRMVVLFDVTSFIAPPAPPAPAKVPSNESLKN